MTMNFPKKNRRLKAGFTLIELLTAISIFAVIMTISMGSIISIFEANRKTRTMKTAITNLNLALETMSKEARFGKNYHCGNTGTLTAPQNCTSGNTFFSFLSSDGDQISYRFNNNSIQKLINTSGWRAVTAPEIVIDDLRFYTIGAATNNNLHPRTIIIIRAHAGTGRNRSDFVLQTMVSQRPLDI